MSASELSTASSTSLSFPPQAPSGANVPHLALHFGLNLAPPLVEHLLEFVIAGRRRFVVAPTCWV